jgi:hypothetical protein
MTQGPRYRHSLPSHRAWKGPARLGLHREAGRQAGSAHQATRKGWPPLSQQGLQGRWRVDQGEGWKARSGSSSLVFRSFVDGRRRS